MAFFPHLQPPRPEVRAFLDDIREHPEDDTPRLILADWLDDYGDETDRARAEFVRLQCLLNQPGVAPRLWQRRQQQLLQQYAADWLGPLAQLIDGWRFERGLLHLEIQGYRCFASELHDLVHTETFAWVEGLTLRRVTGGFINVAEQLPLLRHLQTLTIEESRPGETALIRLVALPELAGLRELNLAGCHVSAAVVQRLAHGSHLEQLCALDLTRNDGGGAAVQALAFAECLPQLRQLHLGYNHIPEDALAVLAESPLLAHLEWLDLRGNLVSGGAGLQAILRSVNAQHLRRLDLGMLPLTPGTTETLVNSPYLGELRQLFLDRAGIGDELLKRLAFSAGLPRLQGLSLARNRISDDGLMALSHGTSPIRLRMLDLSHNRVGPEGAVVLATCPTFEQLAELDLEDNHIADEGALAIASSPLLRRLHFLDAGTNGLTPLGKALLLRRFGREIALV